MPFQGRDDGKRARKGPDPGSRTRHGLSATRSAPWLSAIETLEPRVLLSAASSLSKILLVSEHEFPRSPIVIVPLVSHTTRAVSPVKVIEGPVNLASTMMETGFPADDVPGLRISGTVALDSPPAIGGTSKSSSGVGGMPGPNMTVAGYSTSPLDEESFAPVVIVDPALETDAGYGTISDPLSWPPPPPGVPVSSSGVVATTPVFGASGGDEVSLAGIPEDRHVQVVSTLDSTETSMSVLIPVGPATEAVGVSLHSMTVDDPGAMPVVEEMVLEDEEGDPIAQLGPFNVNGPATYPVRSLTVALEDAPTGGNLLVQVSLPLKSSSGAGTVTTSPQTLGSALPFMMDIQRQDVTAAVSSTGGIAILGALPGQLGSGIGTLNSSSLTGQGGNALDPADSSNSEGENQAQTIVVNPGNVLPPTKDPADSGETFKASADLGVGTGPLVSRSSSPLGPILATLLADPAPPVDRHERALFQFIEESDSDDAGAAVLRTPDDAEVQESASALASERASGGTSDGTRVALAGLGAFPLKVTGADVGNQDADLASLLVTLPGSLQGIGSLAVVAAKDHEMADISAVVTSARDSERTDRIVPNFLITVCGLALGVGLTARPLLPDLLGLLPSRFLSRSRRSVPGVRSGQVDSGR